MVSPGSPTRLLLFSSQDFDEYPYRPIVSSLISQHDLLADVGRRWATPTDLSQFDPFAAEATRHMTSGLSEAYDIADNALDSGLGLRHWKSALAADQDEDDGDSVVNSDDDMCADPDMLHAIDLSLGIDRSQETQQFSMPSAARAALSSAYDVVPERSLPHGGPTPSRFESQRDLPIRKPVELGSRLPGPTASLLVRSDAYVSYSQSSKRPRSPSSSDSDDLPSSLRRRKTSGNFGYTGQAAALPFSSQSLQSEMSSTITISDDDELSSPPCKKKSSTKTRLKAQTYRPQPPNARSSTATPSVLSSKQIFMRNRLSASAAAVPVEDIIEEDLGDSSQFVQIYVGPFADPATDPSVDPQRRQHKLQLLKHHIWDRSYFRDTLTGRNHFRPIGENTWELVHPKLADISPKDFQMVAEFLSDGSFGTRDPDTEEQVAHVFAECVSAWTIAEILYMDDLLDHIVDKIRSTRPWWDLFNVMLFACFIYKSGNPLSAHSPMKTLLSEFIAELYDVYVEEDSLRAEFMTRMKQLPELRRDVHKKIVEQTERRLDSAQEEGEEVAEMTH